MTPAPVWELRVYRRRRSHKVAARLVARGQLGDAIAAARALMEWEHADRVTGQRWHGARRGSRFTMRRAELPPSCMSMDVVDVPLFSLFFGWPEATS